MNSVYIIWRWSDWERNYSQLEHICESREVAENILCKNNAKDEGGGVHYDAMLNRYIIQKHHVEV